jgi:spore maturation protein CgeB
MPACGQVVLGERTSEHLEMFDEGTEALFFSSRIEMWEKVQFLLDNPSVASDIASAGHRRITGGLNTYRDRAAEIIYHLRCMTNEPLD